MSDIKVSELDQTLDFESDELRSVLDKSSEMVVRLYDNVYSQNGFSNHSQAEFESWFNEKVPVDGMEMDDLFHAVGLSKNYSTEGANTLLLNGYFP